MYMRNIVCEATTAGLLMSHQNSTLRGWAGVEIIKSSTLTHCEGMHYRSGITVVMSQVPHP